MSFDKLDTTFSDSDWKRKMENLQTTQDETTVGVVVGGSICGRLSLFDKIAMLFTDAKVEGQKRGIVKASLVYVPILG